VNPARANITALAEKFTAAWNVHDPQAFALTFAPDADFTNVYGVHAHGRPAIEAFHAGVFNTVFKNSRQTTDAIDFVSIDGTSATVRLHWSMTGATIPTWPPVQHGIITWTLRENGDGSWLIAVMTNALAN
jgi:uncharacterized protein (TIGR02246 family)